MGTTTPGDSTPTSDGGPLPDLPDESRVDAAFPKAVPGSRQATRRWVARGQAVGVLVAVALAVLVADAVAKYFVVRQLTGHPPVRTLGGLLYLDEIRNSGAAFSMLSGQTWIFTVVATVAVAVICWMALRLRSLLWAVALGLVAGGALGNLADRVFRAPGFLVGHVVDYLSLFGPDGELFAIFNLADAMLCCGVALAVLLELTGHRRDGTRAARQQDRRQSDPAA